MSFLDRLRECRYISPSGREFTPLFDDLERSGGKKAPVHELPHRDVADVQDLGNAAEKFPMTLYFVGADYDQTADAFYEALREQGRAKLKHPRWGDRDVLPLTRTQKEGFVEGIRCAHFTVDFIEAPDPAQLTISTTTAAAIQSAAESAAASSASALADQAEALDTVETVRLKGAAVEKSRSIFDSLKSLAADADDIRAQMAAQQRAIERNIDTLAAVPIDLMEGMIRLARMPADIVTSVTAKARGYAEIIGTEAALLAGLSPGLLLAGVTGILSATVALSQSTTTGTLSSRADAMDAYNLVTDSTAEALAAVESYVEDPATMAAIRQLSSDARARLLIESYSLPTERSMILQGDSDPITLAVQLYGDPERADDLIAQNHLGGDLIFSIPRGTVIWWYET